MSPEDQDLYDAQAAAQALMADAAEVDQLRARVRELEGALRDVVQFYVDAKDAPLKRLVSVVEHARSALRKSEARHG